jgi:chemotaxis protein methyltransferase WspC
MKINPIVTENLLDRLQAAIGIDPRGLDPARLRWIIAARCRHLNLPDPTAYSAHLDSTPAELDALIDQVVVQETRFFRDPVVFEHIRAALTQLAAAGTGPLRILSAPCGTGEEAYSLAATLSLLGLPPSRFSIDAFDISLSALDVARRGIYSERALTHLAPDMQQALALPQDKHWTIHPTLRERVQFDRRNLAQSGALGDLPQYDLILCRNLFIYLAPSARATLAQSLATALVSGGRLFLGTADRVEELNALFAPMRPAASFAFAHRALTAAAQPSVIDRILSRLHLGRPQIGRLQADRRPHRPIAVENPSQALDPEAVHLAAANDLLNRALAHRQRGEMAKAERRCRQALYLVPNLLPAMELLQSLWDENPNLRLRRALRDRILRTRLLPAAAVKPRPAAKQEETL